MSVKVKVGVVGVKEVARRMEKGKRKLPRNVRAVIIRTGYEIEREAKQRCPVRDSILRNSIDTRIDRAGMKVEVGPTTGYGKFVEFGTATRGASSPHPPLPEGYEHGGAYEIKPVNKKALGWDVEGGTAKADSKAAGKVVHDVVVKRVISHPGMKARPFLFPAVKEVKPDHERRLQVAIREALK
jgi:HK97 gp10 family phage protein